MGDLNETAMTNHGLSVRVGVIPAPRYSGQHSLAALNGFSGYLLSSNTAALLRTLCYITQASLLLTLDVA